MYGVTGCALGGISIAEEMLDGALGGSGKWNPHRVGINET
jgi:hypothetical protein